MPSSRKKKTKGQSRPKARAPVAARRCPVRRGERRAPARKAPARTPSLNQPVTAGAFAGDLEKMDALAQAKGVHGLRETDAAVQLPHDPPVLVALAQQLEELGRARILSFRPLFLVSKQALDFLGGKVVPYVEAFHGTHPKEPGVPFERLADRFDVPRAILKLVLKSLVHEGVLREDDGAFALAGFRRVLPPREEQALEKLEQTCFGGEFRAVTLRDIHEQYAVALPKLEAMLAELVERKRIVAGKDGFYLHARWLEDLVGRLKAQGRREMTIAEFKALTGLSRKFAIPLLEWLDEIGVTRRRGSVREIL